MELDVPEGRYILLTEQQGWGCRMRVEWDVAQSAVKVTKSLEQIEVIGCFERNERRGYALLCVAHATSDKCIRKTRRKSI